MRAPSEALAAKLAGGVTTLAHVWCVVRRDDERFAFTDHDEPLVFDDLVAEPLQGLSIGEIEKSVGLGVDSASMRGALSSEAITEADLSSGLWDGARVDIWRVDWQAPADRMHLFAGAIGDVRRGVAAFEAELRGVQAPLNIPVGRVFSRYCDADLGDARCGVDVDAPAFRGAGVVSEVIGTNVFKASGLGEFADQWFSRGRIVWDAGGASEVAVHRALADQTIIELLDVAPLQVGGAFTIHAGCDKRVETCRDKFANVANFRGFPHMPGNDALQVGPQAGDPLDGGSRRA
ncbi:MAG: DUF2163 domain-containing protein [Hyphomonadaceae bacterium]|nr:DUF2163 domain-containing protein [Hyphomonadaceae bacterium]